MLDFAKKLLGSVPASPVPGKSGVTMECDFFVLEGTNWQSLAEKKCQINFESAKAVPTMTIHCQSESVSETIALDSVSNLTRFTDDDGTSCFQWIVKKGKGGENMEEFGVRFASDSQADAFASQVATLGQQSATVTLELDSGLSLVEKVSDTEWDTIEEDVSVVVSKTKKGEHFLSVVHKRDGALLFHSPLTTSLQLEYRFPVAAFLGLSPLSEDTRVLGIHFEDKAALTTFQAAATAVLGTVRRSARRAAPVVEESSSDEDVEMWEDPAEFKQTPVKSRKGRGRKCKQQSSDEDDEEGDDVVNRHLLTGRKHSRAIVFSNRNSLAGFQVYNTDSPGPLKATSGFSAIAKGLNPSAVMMHQGDAKCLMLDPSFGRDKVLELDLERGKVVNEWTPGVGTSVNAILPISKFSQATEEQTFLGLNDRSVFVMDPRAGTSEITGNRVSSFNYATNVKLNAAATDSDSHIVVANKTGQIRLFDGERNRDGELKRAKTLLAGLGDAISHIELTADGEWILATCATYLILIKTVTDEGVSGFSKSVASAEPITLALEWNDITKYKLSKIEFSPARFDEKKGLILASTGSLAIVWDFAKIKRTGHVAYSVKPMKDYILDTSIVGTGAGRGESVVAMYENKVELARVRK